MGRWNRTHEALSQTALELFTEYGYEATGTAQIAQRAGVSEMTLFRHFPTKDALLLADPFDPVMAEAIRLRPAQESAMQAVIGGIQQALAQVDDHTAEALRHRLRIVADTPSLRGAVDRNSQATAKALVSALCERGITEVNARVVATAVIAGLSEALLWWAATETAQLSTTLHDALETLGGQSHAEL